MEIQCECGTFRAELTGFPKNTPGRFFCYCDDCQTYMHFLDRADLMDEAGGCEIVPVYPSEMKFTQGSESLKCVRLSSKGLYRWTTTCCKTPILNTSPGMPWLGVASRVYTVKDPTFLQRTLGEVRCRIEGRFARGTPPPGTSEKATFKDFLKLIPFLLKGVIKRKGRNSPFFKSDGKTPIVTPYVLTIEERNAIRTRLGFQKK